MSGKIELYYDCVSPYSWFALDYLIKNKEALGSHDVQIEYNYEMPLDSVTFS
jgi:glutathione S-transferase kappa 1